MIISIDQSKVKPSALTDLEKLDKESILTQRNLRDFIKLTVEALKLGQPIDLTPIPGVQKVIAVEAQAALLRAQL